MPGRRARYIIAGLAIALAGTFEIGTFVVACGPSGRLPLEAVLATGVLLLTIALGAFVVVLPVEREFERQRRSLLAQIEAGRASEAAAQETRRRLAIVIERIPALLWSVDSELRFTATAGAALADIGQRPGDGVGFPLQALGHADDGTTVTMHRAALRGESRTYRNRFYGRTYQAYVEPERASDGAIVGVIGVAFDVTDLEQASRALAEREAQLANAQELAGLGSWRYDVNSRTATWSRELYELLGFDPDGPMPSRAELSRCVLPEEAASVRRAIADARAQRVPYCIDRRVLRTNGSLRWVQQRASYEYDAQGRPTVVTGTLLDITERKLAQERLAFAADHDPLTGLVNRRGLSVLVDTMLAADPAIAVLFIEVGGLKAVSDAVGHAGGDEFIAGVARRIVEHAPPDAVVARFGSDEFVVAMRGDPQFVGSQIVTAFAHPFAAGGREFYSSVRIGSSAAPADGTTSESLLRNADTAMSAARRAGRNTVRAFSPLMPASAAERATLEADLRRALAAGELVPYYQPIVDRRGLVVGVEALVRWRHPTKGLVPPDAFLPVAEETGLIVALGESVLRRACSDAGEFARGERGLLRVAVNVSAHQFQHPDFAETVCRVLQETGLSPARLELEITETALMTDVDVMFGVLARLRALGVRFSIDDFGTGYSSLSYLKRLPVDTLKIDKSFVRDLASENLDAAIARAIVTLAQSLNLRVIAEGVETAAQRAYLGALGCDEFQGYYFGRPVPAEALRALLARGATLPEEPGTTSERRTLAATLTA